jgi:hypothetical protein
MSLRGVFGEAFAAHQRSARTCIRRASRQGHPDAIERMTAFRRFVYCNADDAPRKCALCREKRYCSKTCSEKHWRRGRDGYDAEDLCPEMNTQDLANILWGYCGMPNREEGDDAPHKHTCPRTLDITHHRESTNTVETATKTATSRQGTTLGF